MGLASDHRSQWLGIELRHLAALAAIAEVGSFRGAADQLGYVQSAISNQIGYLERVVGTRLIDRSRGPGPVALTDAGKLLLRHSDGIIARLDAARADVNALIAGRAGVVRVAVEQIAGEYILPQLTQELARERPDISLVPVETLDQLQRLGFLESGVVDASFLDLPVANPNLEACEALTDPYVLVVSARHPLAALERRLTFSDLSGVTLLGGPASLSPAVPFPLVSPAGRGVSWAGAQSLAAAGQDAALVPSLAVDARDPRIAVLELDHLLPPRVLALCWLRDRELSESVGALCATLQRCQAGGAAALRAAA